MNKNAFLLIISLIAIGLIIWFLLNHKNKQTTDLSPILKEIASLKTELANAKNIPQKEVDLAAIISSINENHTKEVNVLKEEIADFKKEMKKYLKNNQIKREIASTIRCEDSKEYYSCIQRKELTFKNSCLQVIPSNVSKKYGNNNKKIKNGKIEEQTIMVIVSPEKTINRCSYSQSDIPNLCKIEACSSK